MRKILFSGDDRFKRHFINVMIASMPSVGFFGLKEISDPHDFNIEGMCVLDGITLKISIFGNEHQLCWNIQIYRDSIEDVVIIRKVVSKLIFDRYTNSGTYLNKDGLETFIKTVHSMKTQASIIKEKVEIFLNEHGKKIAAFQEETEKRILEFSKTLDC